MDINVFRFGTCVWKLQETSHFVYFPGCTSGTPYVLVVVGGRFGSSTVSSFTGHLCTCMLSSLSTGLRPHSVQYSNRSSLCFPILSVVINPSTLKAFFEMLADSCPSSRVDAVTCYKTAVFMFIIIIIIIIISSMQDIYTCVSETNHVSREYSVAAIL